MKTKSCRKPFFTCKSVENFPTHISFIIEFFFYFILLDNKQTKKKNGNYKIN